MKKLILFLLAITFSLHVFGQDSYNYYAYGVGAYYGPIKAGTNIKGQKSHPSVNFDLVYNFSPYVQFSLSYQFGKFSGGQLSTSQDKFGRKYSNNFGSLAFQGDLQLGEIIDYDNSNFLNIVKNAYAGLGVGGIVNSTISQSSFTEDTHYLTAINKHSVSFIMPLRLGYDLKIYDVYDQPSYSIDLAYVRTVTIGSTLDGFDGNRISHYQLFCIGIKYYFGGASSYDKSISRSKDR